MLKNYFLIARRLLVSNFVYFIVNLIGLSLGIACCVIAYFNWEFHNNFDSGHRNSDRIYKVNLVKSFDGNLYKYGTTPVPLVDHLLNGFENVEAATRYDSKTGVIRVEDRVFNQQIGFVDHQFLDVFSFKPFLGTNDIAGNQVLITYNSAIKIFGTEECVGKSLDYQVDDLTVVSLKVAGVLRNHPLNSSFKYDLLADRELIIPNEQDWTDVTHASFVLLKNNADFADFNQTLQGLIDPLNESREDWVAEEYRLVGLKNMANEARYIRANYLGQNNPEGAIMIPNIMAVIILLVACFNFMNTSISLSTKRLKEIGVRKAIGARRGQLIFQLLSENFIVICLSLVLGILLAEFLIPFYSQLGPWIDLKIDYQNNFGFFLFLVALLFFTGIIGGAYPSFYVSKFNTANIFSGNFKLKNSGALSKGLMVFQLGFSLIALIQGIVYIQNTSLQKNFDLGYNKSAVITLPIKEGMDFDAFKDDLLGYSDIKGISGSTHHFGYANSSGNVEINELKKDSRVFEVGQEYLETMDLKLVDGRDFYKDSESDQSESVIVSEYFLEAFNITSPIDKRVLIDKNAYRIIGVVQNFYPYGLWRDEAEYPSIIKLSKPGEWRFISINVTKDLDQTDELIKAKWGEYFKDLPYESDKYNIHVYRSELLSNNMATLNIFLALTALFLSVTGIYTLISINVQRRRKEISLRRLMGASIGSVMGLVNKGYIILIGLSVLVGSLSGAYLTEMFLDLMYSVHAHVGFFSIGLTSGLVIIVVFVTSGYRVYIATNTPPAEILKEE